MSNLAPKLAPKELATARKLTFTPFAWNRLKGFSQYDVFKRPLHLQHHSRCRIHMNTRTLQLRPPAARRAAKAAACLPVAAVNPSGLTSVFPSIGFSPIFATAKYTSTCHEGDDVYNAPSPETSHTKPCLTGFSGLITVQSHYYYNLLVLKHGLLVSMQIYIYIYICVRMCVDE